MAIDKEFPVNVISGNTEAALWVQARNYMGPQQVVIERVNGGLVVLSLAEAKALIDVLRQAVEALEQ